MDCRIPSYVKLSNIDYRPRRIKDNRYYLYFRFSNQNSNHKTMIVIMKNPSKTFLNNHLNKKKDYNNKYLDRSTLRAINFAHSKNYKAIMILNLYSYYASNPKGINVHYNFISRSNPGISKQRMSNTRRYHINMYTIQKIIKKYNNPKNRDIVLAWGKANGIYKGYYDNRIEKVMKILNGLRLKEVAKNGNQCKCQNLNNKICYPKHPQIWKYKNGQPDYIF